jgi:hypothetical protein
MNATWTLASALAACSAACSSAGSSAPTQPALGPPGFTKIDDMEQTGNAVAWIPQQGKPTRGAWTAHAADGTDGILPRHGAWSYEALPAPYETFPDVTSRHAARLRTTAPIGSWGANMAFVFSGVPAKGDASVLSDFDTHAPVDLSAYTGITFWAMAAPDGGSSTLRVSFVDRNTDPSGGVCTDDAGGFDQCLNGFNVQLPLTGSFTRYTVDFSQLAQDPSWGYHPTPDVFDAREAYAVAFQVDNNNGADGVTFDIWVDDLCLVSR